MKRGSVLNPSSGGYGLPWVSALLLNIAASTSGFTPTALLDPEDGKSYWLILPRANTKAMSVALAEFAKDLAPKGDKRILLLLDRASYHTTDKLCVPEP